MKSNIVIKVLSVCVALVLIVILISSRSGQDIADKGDRQSLSEVESGPIDKDNGLSSDPLNNEYLVSEYGVDVDSPVETMRTLTKETKAVRQESIKLQEENAKLKNEIQQLLSMEQNINKRIDSKLQSAEMSVDDKQRELEHKQSLTDGLIAQLENKLANIKETGKKTARGYDISSADIPDGLGYDENGRSINLDEVVWTSPLEAKVNPQNPLKYSLPKFTDDAAKKGTALKQNLLGREKSKEERSIRAYTIPVNATMIGSVSMTALLGRIPVGSQVVDPYPFKIMVGEENLSSNGIHIPGVIGVVMSGIAKGDWTLSCVSGEIRSMTFTFTDGTIVTYPEPGNKTAEAIAWFSDRYGIPCVTGERITNAVSYLGQRVALTAASSYANAQAQGEFSSSTNSEGNTTRVLTGDPTVVAKNTAISSGLNEVTDWLDQRQSNSFDAIYVPPGTELVIHVSDELKIDYDPEGRKVNHYAKINRHSDRYLD